MYIDREIFFQWLVCHRSAALVKKVQFSEAARDRTRNCGGVTHLLISHVSLLHESYHICVRAWKYY
jgi:hypothetical protein